MAHSRRWAAAAAVGILLAAAGTAVVQAATAPQVATVLEGRSADGERRVLVLTGTGLTKFKEFALQAVGGTGPDPAPPVIVSRSATLLLLELPSGIARGDYLLVGTYGRGLGVIVDVNVNNGSSPPATVPEEALTDGLRTELDDAETLNSHDGAWYRDAGNTNAGTLSTDRFSARDDLVAEGKIGTGATQVAAGDHEHDARYLQIGDAGTSGTVNDAGNPLDWSKLKGVPAGFADGTDADTTYTASTGLSLSAGAFSVDFAGTGSAPTAARSDHQHDAAYVAVGANTLAATHSLAANLTGSANPVLKVDNTNTTGTAYGIRASNGAVAGRAIYGVATRPEVPGTVAIEGENLSGAGTGVLGTGTIGVHGQATSTTGHGVEGTGGAAAIWGWSYDSATTDGVYGEGEANGVRGRNTLTTGNGVTGELTSTGATGFGVYGKTTTVAGAGVCGESTAASGGENRGVYGKVSSLSGSGVYGENTGTSGGGYGVHGLAWAAAGVGVVGQNTDPTGGGNAVGVRGQVSGIGTGVEGFAFSGTSGTGVHGRGKTNGMEAEATGAGGTGIIAAGPSYSDGIGVAASGGVGVYAASTGGTARGVWAHYQDVAGSTNTGYGLWTEGTAVLGTGSAVGLMTTAFGATASSSALIADYRGVVNQSPGNVAVFQYNGSNVARIDPTGKGYFNGGTVNSGADVAESVAAAAPATLEPGDVLVIDVAGARRFARSEGAESSLVAGVYATRPGLLLRNGPVEGNAAAGEVPLAVVGIVPTKVCDEGGPVRVGDLLVTASLPGHAKRAPENPRAGTLLGKALGNLDRGAGTMEVLLMAR